MRFVVSEIEESKDFSRNEIPSGFYHVCVTDVDFTPTKNGAGEVFKINFGIMAPETEKGQGLTAFIIYSHTSQAAVRIGHAALADFLFTLQVGEFSSVSELRTKVLAKELIVEVVNEETDLGTFPRIADYWSRGGRHRSGERGLKEVNLTKTNKLIKKKGRQSSVTNVDF
jgi:hypothetical protein